MADGTVSLAGLVKRRAHAFKRRLTRRDAPNRRLVRCAVRNALDAGLRHRLLCERLEPRYLLSADLLPLSADHPDALDLTLDYDATTQVLELIDNDVLDEQGHPAVLATFEAPAADQTLTIAYDPSYGDNGALIIGDEPDAGTGPRVEITASGNDDTLTLRGFGFDGPSVYFDGGEGDDLLVVEHAGDASHALSHVLTGPQHGRLSATEGGTEHTYGGVEQVEVGVLADTQTITLTNAANLTLSQDLDGNLVSRIQHAFDAHTDLSQLAGTDGFAVVANTADAALGAAVSAAGDVNADGIDDVIVGVPGLDRAYVIFGSDQDFPAQLDPNALDGSNGFVLTGPAGQNVGFAVGGGADVDGDGIDDLVIGAPGPDGSFGVGTGYIVFGTDQGFAASIDLVTLDGSSGYAITGAAAGDAAGYSVAIVGDINGDQIGDVLIGAPGADPGGLADAGAAYLVFGTAQARAATLSLNGLDGKNGFALVGAAAGDALGSAVAGAGDVNTDALMDVVVGAPGSDVNGADAGAAYVFFGAIDYAVAEGLNGLLFDTGPISSLSEARDALGSTAPTATFLAYEIDYPNSDGVDTIETSTSLEDFLGLNVEELAGEEATVDGSVFTFDGYLHVAAPGTYTFEVGSAEGFSLSIDGEVVAEFDGTRDFAPTSGSYTFAEAGFYELSLLYYTDSDPAGIELKSDLVTADGTLDFISREYLFTNPPQLTYAVATFDGATGFAIVGEAQGDGLGTAVGAAGDVNASGAADVIVGAPGSDAGGEDSGRAYVVFGRTSTSIGNDFAATLEAGALDTASGLVLTGAGPGARAGTAVGSAGDLNVDGIADVLVGAPGVDAGQAGTVQVLFGDDGLGDAGPIDLGKLDGVRGFSANLTGTGDGVGGAAALAGDLNADGDDDLIVGAPLVSGGAGGATVLFGRAAGGQTTKVTYTLPASAFTIDGANARARITLGASADDDLLGDDIDTDQIDFNGVDFSVSAKDITVKADITISTRRIAGTDYANDDSTGDSADITLSSRWNVDNSGAFTGGHVTIETGAALYAHVEEGSAFAAGDITITADSTNTTAVITTLLNEGRRSAAITVDSGVSILGGDIDIAATAGIVPVTTGMSAGPAGFISALGGILSPLAGILSLPLAVQVSIVDATVDIGGSGPDAVTITGSGDVSIEASALANAKGNALMWFNPVKTAQQYGFAVGVWVAESTSTVTLHDGVTVTSSADTGDTHSVRISADSVTRAGGSARVSQNLESQISNIKYTAPNNPNNIALAFGVAYTSTTATVDIRQGAEVIADAGNVSITASGDEEVDVKPSTRSYDNGLVGVAFGVEITRSDIRTLVDGTVQANGTESRDDITFDPFTAVNTAADTIFVGFDTGLRTGDRVAYSSDIGRPIDGLAAQGTYYVIVVDGLPDGSVQLAATEEDAHAGIAIDLIDNPALVETTVEGERSLSFPRVGSVTDTIYFGFEHHFDAGAAVVYRAAEGKRIGGLVDGQTYYVVLVDGDDSVLQLATDAAGTNIVDLDTSPVFTTADGRELVVDSVDAGDGVITFTAPHGLAAGDAVTFHPAFALQLSDPLSGARYGEGTAFYAIPSPSDEDPSQLDPLRIRLARTADEAIGSNGYTNTIALEVDTSTMSGTEHLLAPAGNGITVMATLDADHAMKVKAGIGGHEHLIKKVLHPEFAATALGLRQSFYDVARNPLLQDAASSAQPAGDQADTSGNTLQLAASLGYLDVQRTVQAVVGSHAELESGTDVHVRARADERGDMDVDGGASVGAKDKVRVDVGASISVSTYHSVVRAVVNDGASVDAAGNLNVEAQTFRRFPLGVDSPSEFLDDLLGDLRSNPTGTIVELNEGLLNPLFETSFTHTQAIPKAKDGNEGEIDVAVAFVMHLTFEHNTTEAIIADGAQINQNPDFRADGQSVDVNAETELHIVDVTGVFEYGFELTNIVKNLADRLADRSADMHRSSSPLADVGVDAEHAVFGTSVQWIDVTNRTLATIGGSSPVDDGGDDDVSVPASGEPVRVHSGPDGDVSVTAHDTVWHFGFVDTAAKTSKGASAFGGGLSMFRYNPDDSGHTIARIASGAVISGGSVNIRATDQVILIAQNGEIITGDSGASVGAGVNILELHRRVRAYVGDFDGTSTTATDMQLDDGAKLTVEARSEGTTVGFSLAGTVRTDAPPPDEPDGQSDAPELDEDEEDKHSVGAGANTGRSGWALAGDATVIDVVADQVLAFVDDVGTIAADGVSVTARSDNNYFSLSGAFSVARTNYASNTNTSLAGSFAGIELHRGDGDALERYDSDTLAYIRRAQVDIGAQGLQLSADRRGVYWGTAAGGSGVSRGSGIEVAGSAAWTDLDYATRAFVAAATISLAGDSSITARDRVAVVSFAGDGIYQGNLGFGTAWAWNQVDRRVQATVLDSVLTQSIGTLSVDAVLWDVAKDDGRTLLPNAFAVAATLGIGDQDTTTAELTGTVAVNRFNTRTQNPAVEASLQGSTISPLAGATGTTGVSLSATDNTSLFALAGAVDGVATVTIGVAAAVNELGDRATTFVEDSGVDVRGGDVTVAAVVNPQMNAFAVGVAVSDANGAVLAGSGAQNSAVGLEAEARVTRVDEDTSITGAGTIHVHGEISYTDFAAGAGQFGVQPKAKTGAAIGAAVAVNDLSDNAARAEVTDAELSAKGDIEIAGRTSMAPGGVILGIAVGGDGGATAAAAGSVVDNDVSPTTRASVSGPNARLTTKGEISITAEERDLVVSSGAGVISATTSQQAGAAVGAAVATNTVDSMVGAVIETAMRTDGEPSIESTAGNVTISAKRDSPRIVAVALGGESAQEFALGGSVATNTVTHRTDAHVSGGSYVRASDSVMVEASEESPVIVAAAGNFTLSNQGVAIGAAIPTNTVTRHLQAYVGDADRNDFDAGPDGGAVSASSGSATVSARRSNSLLLAIGVSGEGAENFALGGSVVENDIKTSVVDAHVWGGGLDGDKGATIEASDTHASNGIGAGNVDLKFLLRSGGAEEAGGDAGDGAVNEQDFISDEIQNAEEADVPSSEIDNQAGKVEEDLEEQANVDPLEKYPAQAQELTENLNAIVYEEDPPQLPQALPDGSPVTPPIAESEALEAGTGISVGIALANNLSTSSTVTAFASDASLNSDAGSVEVHAHQTALFVTVAGSGSFSGDRVEIEATEATTDYRPTTRAYIDAVGGQPSQVTSAGNVIVAADSVVHGVTVAGNVAINKGGTSVALGFATTAHRTATTEAYIDNADVTANANQDATPVATGLRGERSTDANFRGVSVTATSRQVFTTVAAGIEVGKTNVAASVSMNLIGDATGDPRNLITRAFIGSGATVNEDDSQAAATQSVNVFAHSDTTVHGGGGAVGFSTGETWGGGAGADGGKIAKLTEAYLAAPTVNATNLILVQAYSSETLVSGEGSIELSAGSELAGALGIYVLDLVTHAYVTNGSNVHSQGSVLVAANDDDNVLLVAGTIAGAEGGTAVGASIGVTDIVGDTRAWVDEGATVTGVAATGTDTIAAATGNYTISYTDEVADDELAPPGNVPSGTTGDGALSADDPAWTQIRRATAEYSDIRGVAVTANSTDAIRGVVGTIGGSKDSAVVGAFFVQTTTRTTEARVSGAVNPTDDLDASSASQDVVVAAGSDFHSVAVTGLLGVSEGSADIAPSVSWHTADLTTQAYVDQDATVTAGGDVFVVAVAYEHLTRVAVGVAESGGEDTASVEGSVTGLHLTSTTTAYVGSNATVTAVGNVVIAARDDTVETGVAGGIALALADVSGAVGGAVVYTHIDKMTEAYVDVQAVVDGGGESDAITVLDGEINSKQDGFLTTTLNGVAVQAQSTETVTNFGLAGSGAAELGIAGGATYTRVDSDTRATVADEARINRTERLSASGAQSVNVSAVNAVKVLDVGGAFSIGGVAITGGFSIGVVRNSTTASIGAGASVAARRDVHVHAASIKDVRSYSVSVAVGAVGVPGSVSVWTIGDKFSPHYDTVKTTGNDALAIQDQSDTQDPAYDSVYQSSNGQRSYIDGQANRADLVSALSGYGNPDDDPNQANLIALRDQGSATTQANSDAQASAASDALGASDLSDVQGVTEAAVAGTVEAGRDLGITSREWTGLRMVTGAGELGGSVGVGAAVGVAAVRGAALAHLDGSATVGGDVLVSAERRADYHGDAIIGEAGFVAAGAGIAVVVDRSVQEAYVGDGAEILQAGSIDVSARRSYAAFELLVVEAQAGLIGAAGASVASGRVVGATRAYIGDATIGDPDTAAAAVGDVRIEATSSAAPRVRAYAGTGGLTVAGDGARADAYVTPTVEAFYASMGGPRATGAPPESLNRIGGDLTIAANSTAEPDAVTLGIGVSVGVAVPVSLPTAIASPTVRAYVGPGSIAHVVGNGSSNPATATGRLEISAVAADDPHASGSGAGGALGLAVEVSVTAATIDTTLAAYIGDDSIASANTDVVVHAEHEYVGKARAWGLDLGILSVGINNATLTIEPDVQAYIGAATVTAQGDVEVVADSGEPGELPDLTFDSGTSVDYATNVITFDHPHGLETGDSVVYHADDGSPIPGLEDGLSYDVIRVSGTQIKLGVLFTSEDVDAATGTIRFDRPHGLDSGSPVVYDNNGNPSVNGLVPGLAYFVNALHPGVAKLASTAEIAANTEFGIFDGRDDVDLEADEIRLPVAYLRTGEDLFLTGTVVFQDNQLVTNEASTRLQVGDAVIYVPPGSLEGLVIKPLDPYRAYFVARVATVNGQVQVALAETRADALAGHVIELSSNATGGRLIGVDGSSWQLTGAGVNSPAAWIDGGKILEAVSFSSDPTKLGSSTEPWPFQTGDLVVWTRHDGDYGTGGRFGLLPGVAYYANVTNGGSSIQFAESLADLANGHFVKLSLPTDVADNHALVSELNSFLSPGFPVQTGDAFTYHAPQPIPVAGEDINAGTPEQPDLPYSLLVTVGDRLYTTVLDLVDLPAVPGEQRGLLGSWYGAETISNLSEALSVAQGSPPGAWVSSGVLYPGSGGNTAPSGTTIAGLLGPDADSLVGAAATRTIPNLVLVFEGFVRVDKAGTYEFEVRSDDGFQLTIDNQVVTSFAGTRGFASSTGNHSFNAPGFYPIQLVYFNAGGSGGVQLRSDLRGKDGNGNNLILDDTLLFLPQGLTYDGPATSSGTDTVSPLERGANYAVISGQGFPYAGILMPLDPTLNPNADALASVHQFRVPGFDPIDGLEDGRTYYMIVDETRPGVVRLADSRADARDRVAIDLGAAPSLAVPVEGVRTTDELGSDAIAVTGAAGDASLWRVAAAGDFNGDTLSDVLITASGTKHLVFGSGAAMVDLTIPDATRQIELDLPGTVLAGVGDINADGIEDIAFGDPGADTISVVLGSSMGFPATVSSADFVIIGAGVGSRLGAAIAGADLNGDGIDDLILGAPGTDKTYVVFGAADLGITGTVDLGVLAGGGNGLQGAFYDTDKLPTLDEAVLAAGLQTPDWLFTSTQLDYPADADYVFDTQGLAALLGNDAPAGTPATDLTGSVFTYRGYLDVPQAGTYTFVVNADDGFRLSIDGQVVTEKIIRGAFSAFPGTAVVTFDRAGLVPIELVHWEYGDATGVRLESDIGGSMGLIPTDLLYTTGGFVIEGAVAGSEFGSEVADARDLNADGVEDIVIAAPAAAGGAGEVYALYGASHARGTSFDLGSLSARTGGLIRGTTGSAAGTSLAGLGDVNGDGYGDLAIGAPLGSAPDKSYVVFGRERFDAAVDLGALDGGAGFGISGGGASSLVSAAGDMNADGLADLAVAQPQTASGQVTVVYGSPTLGEDGSISLSTVADGLDGFTVVGTTPDGLLGASLAGAGDVDGDGVSDLLMAQRGGAIVVRGAPARAAFESVHANANTIEFAGAGALATGDALYYTGAPGVHVGGLEANTVYYAIATGSGDTLQLARTATDAAAGRFIELDLSPRLEIVELGESFTVRPGSVHDTLTFDQMPAIQNGQAVVYREAWGTRLVGLRDGETYYAIVSNSLPARTIRLAESAVRALNSDGSTNYLLFHVGAHEVSGTHYLGLEGIGITPPGSDLALGTMTDADDLDGVDGLSLDGAVANGAAGTAVTGVGDVDGDGFDDALVVGAAGSHLVFGFDEIDVARLDLGAFGERGVEITLAGQTSGLVGDLNGDSFADIVIGNTVAGNGAGEVSIVFGTAAGFSAGIGTADLTISGLQAGDLLGSAIAGADIDNDGMTDLVIGAPGAGSGRGAVYVIFGGTDFGASAIDLAELDGSSGFAIAGDLAGGEAGRVVSSAGDVNSDLIEDLVFGAPGIDRAYVLFGSSGSFAATLSTADLAGRSGIVLAGGTGTRTGAAVGSAGDVDGDGADDLLIGAPLADPTDRVDAGQSYLVFGSGRSFPSLVDLTALDGSTGVVLNGVDAGDSSGAAVSGVGDINGDGLGDFMVGAPLAAANGLPSAGSAYLVFGSSDLRGTASIELGLLGQRGATFNGSHAGDTLGTALAGLGDFNGDQVADLVLGAPNVTGDGRPSAGRAYVVFGADPNARHYLVHDLAAPPKAGAQRLEQSRDLAPSGLTGTPKVTAWGMGGHLIGGDGASATATITPIVRAFIGAAAGFDTASGAQVTAVGGDVYIEAFSATDVEATTTGYDISLLAGGGSAHATMTLQDVMTEAYVGRDVVVQAENGKFTLLASSSDTLTGTASAVSAGALDIFVAYADVTAQRRVQATIGAATVTAADIEIDALKSTHASAHSTADAGGDVVVPLTRAILTVGDSATPTVKVLVSGGARLDATGGTVKLRAANFSEGASARDHLSAITRSRSIGYYTGQNSTARITLNEYAQNHTVDNGSVEADSYNVVAALDWEELHSDATGRTRSVVGVPTVRATLEGTVQGGNFLSGATSYLRPIGHDVQNDPDIVTVHTLQNFSVFWARIPAKHPNQENTLSIDPLPPQPPPSDDAVESTDPPTPPPPGPVNSVPESLTLEPASLEVGGIRVGDELRIGGTFYDGDLDDVHQASVDWGDGTVEILTLVQVAGGGLYHGGHVYAQGGIYEVQVTVTDDSNDSFTDSLSVPVTGMRVHEGVLQIVGSPGHDEVYFDRVGNDLVVMANLDDALVDQGVRVEFGRHALNEIGSVVVVLGRGEDYAEVISGGVTLPVSLDGGAGFDEFVSVRPVVLDGDGGFRVRGTDISGTNFESIKGPVPAMATVFEPSSLTLNSASEFTAIASDTTGSEAVSAQGQRPGEAAATQTDEDVGSRLEVARYRVVDVSPDGSEEDVAAPSATVSAQAAVGEERVRIDRSREQRVLVAADRSMALAARNDGEMRRSKSTLAADTRPHERSSQAGIHRVEGTTHVTAGSMLVRTDLFDTGPAAAASIILRAAPIDPWIRGVSTTQDHAPSAATHRDVAEEDLWFDEDDGRLKPVSRAHTIETPPLIDRETGWALYGFDRKPTEPGVYLFK